MIEKFVIDVDGFDISARPIGRGYNKEEIHDMMKRAIAVAVHEGAYSNEESVLMIDELKRLIELDRCFYGGRLV